MNYEQRHAAWVQYRGFLRSLSVQTLREWRDGKAQELPMGVREEVISAIFWELSNRKLPGDGLGDGLPEHGQGGQ